MALLSTFATICLILSILVWSKQDIYDSIRSAITIDNRRRCQQVPLVMTMIGRVGPLDHDKPGPAALDPLACNP